MPAKKSKKALYHENIQAQELLQAYVKPETDAISSLEWLDSAILASFFEKLAFDNHSTPSTIILVTISFIWLFLRYARSQHPGSKPLRIGHHRLLAAISGGGKNAAIRLLQRCGIKACNLFGIDARCLGLFDIDVVEINDEMKEEPEEQDILKQEYEAMKQEIYNGGPIVCYI